MQSRFLGGMVGSALGDAIGELAFRGLGEADLRSEIDCTDLLIYTDDTAMAIGLAESILQVGHLDPQHLGDTFRANHLREPWRGYATGPPTVFALVADCDLAYSEAARSLFGGQGSFGNGAAMRVGPVGLFFSTPISAHPRFPVPGRVRRYGRGKGGDAHDMRDLYEQARISASVTHAHPIGIDGAAVLARAIARAVTLSPQQPFPFESFCQQLIDYARTVEIRDKMVLVRNLIADQVSPADAARRLGRTVAVHESMPFALYAFLRHPQSFEACLFCAVLNGGDRDTLGAMAGAVSGAYLGVGAIPLAWRQKLENGPYVEGLARDLAGLAERKA